MPYWINLVLDNDKGEPTYLQRAKPGVVMEFRRWPDVPTPGVGGILPMKLIFKDDFVDKYRKSGSSVTKGTGTSSGKPVQKIRIMLKSGSHLPEGYAFDALMEDDNGVWKTWDPRVVSK